jgi:xylulokinase
VTDAVLAIDLGTSATKLLAVSPDGAAIARSRLPHRTSRPEADAAEQNPAEWWDNLVAGIVALREALPGASRIAGIGVTGQMHGLVIHDKSGDMLRPAITWEDRRASATLPALLERLPNDHPAIVAGYQAASWHWLTETEPEIATRAAHLRLPKDEIVYRLTGRHVTDPSDAVGTGWYRAESGDWDADIVSAAGARANMLPNIVPAGSVAGPLTREAADALGLDPDIPVVIAGADAAVAAFGAGATDPGTPLIMLSTGCQALQPSETRPKRDGWPSASPPGLSAWLRVATTLNGGNVVGWARETFGEPAPRADAELVFLPYLAGERSATLAGDASGAFIGLRGRHGRAELARAAIDGVSLALADAFERAGGEIGVDPPVLAGGGGTRDRVWLQSLADALARPVEAVTEPDLSAWGAARSAATALRWIDPAATPNAWRPETRAVAPGSSRAGALARLDRVRALAARLFAPESR